MLGASFIEASNEAEQRLLINSIMNLKTWAITALLAATMTVGLSSNPAQANTSEVVVNLAREAAFDGDYKGANSYLQDASSKAERQCEFDYIADTRQALNQLFKKYPKGGDPDDLRADYQQFRKHGNPCVKLGWSYF